MVFLGSNLGFKILDASSELDVSASFTIDSLLEINILVSVLLFKSSKMVELVLEADNLVLELDDFTFTFNELSFLALKIKGLGVNELVEVINSSKLLRDVVLKSSGLSGKFSRFSGFHLVGTVKLIDFFSISSVSFTKVMELLFEMLLLRVQLGVKILMLSEVRLELGNLSVSVVEDALLGIELSIEISILLLSINE